MDWLNSVIEYGIIDLLVCMSVVALAIAIERYRFLRQVSLHDFQDRQLLELALTRRLHLIATIGSNAPYVGLLGTVLGIMLIFLQHGPTGYGGFGQDHDRSCPDIEGDGCRIAGRHSSGGALQSAPAEGQGTAAHLEN